MQTYRIFLLVSVLSLHTVFIVPMHTAVWKLDKAAKCVTRSIYKINISHQLEYYPDECRIAQKKWAEWTAETIPAKQQQQLFKDPEVLIAAYYNQNKINRLLNAGYNPNKKYVRPLHDHAWWHGYNGILMELIAHGAYIDSRDWQGRTPLMIAAAGIMYTQINWPEILGANTAGVSILLDAGANKKIKCKEGMNASDHAYNAFVKGVFDEVICP